MKINVLSYDRFKETSVKDMPTDYHLNITASKQCVNTWFTDADSPIALLESPHVGTTAICFASVQEIIKLPVLCTYMNEKIVKLQ